MELVSLIKCGNYDENRVLESVRAALKPFGGMQAFVRPGKVVLLKVSMLRGAPPESAINTHPAVVRAVAHLVTKSGGRVVIGDSCAGVDHNCAESAMETSGYTKLAEDLGCETVLFDDQKTSTLAVRYGLYLDKFRIAEPMAEADVIINLPKLKTDVETLMTGAVKNMLGALPSVDHPDIYRLAPTPYELGDALLDIYKAIMPTITIMDAIDAMEGNGPTRGRPVHLGAVLASRDGVALDHVGAQLLGYNPAIIPTITSALQRNIGENRSDYIDIVGDPVDDLVPDRLKKAGSALMINVPKRLLEVLSRRYFRVEPTWLASKCAQSDLCIHSCPTSAISRVDGRNVIDSEKCIQCLYCYSLCPSGGIDLSKTFLARLFDRS